jgi:hypothetical protein
MKPKEHFTSPTIFQKRGIIDFVALLGGGRQEEHTYPNLAAGKLVLRATSAPLLIHSGRSGSMIRSLVTPHAREYWGRLKLIPPRVDQVDCM